MAPPKTRTTRATNGANSIAHLHGVGNGPQMLSKNDQNHASLFPTAATAAAAAMRRTTKRKADANSPVRNDKAAKRSALGNLTNAVLNNAGGGQQQAGIYKPTAAVATKLLKAATVPLQQQQQQQHRISDGIENAVSASNVHQQQHNTQQHQQQQPHFVAPIPLLGAIGSQNSIVQLQLHQQQQLQLQQQCLAAPRPTKMQTRAAARAILPGDTALKPTAVVGIVQQHQIHEQQQQQQLQQQMGHALAPEQQQQQQQQLKLPQIPLDLLEVPAIKSRRRISNEFECQNTSGGAEKMATAATSTTAVGGFPHVGGDTDENSLYMSALESCSESDRSSRSRASSMGLANLSADSNCSSGSSGVDCGVGGIKLEPNVTLSTSTTLAIAGMTLCSGGGGQLKLEKDDGVVIKSEVDGVIVRLEEDDSVVVKSEAAAVAVDVADDKQSVHDTIVQRPCPPGVVDFDRENWDDPFQASHYAMDIFNYLKTREPQFQVDDYIGRQGNISKWMRSLLVDWMVEVQETFELNHETLYLAVKVVDLYLAKVLVVKDKLQLLGAAAIFLACKYDERTPPLIEDFLYICDGAYVQRELIVMEMDVFRTIGYDLGMPLSYRLLRRYARVSCFFFLLWSMRSKL